MFRRFGSQVTVVNRGPQLMGREDADVADAIQQILCEDGIDIVFNAATQRVSASSSGGIELTVQAPGGERTVAGSHLLVATGRRPNSDQLNLAAAAVDSDERGFITVNDRLETTSPDVYALGDVKGGPAFTHISYDDFRIIRTNLLEGGQATTKDRLVPYCVYTDPQLGRIGMSERKARASGRPVKVARLPMTSVARALEAGETRGFIKAVVDPGSRQILGAACLSLEGGEIMSMFEIAMMGQLPYTALRDGIFAHPTLAELLNNLFSRLED
jgi:pyruvate/2-oxoglutarate dehydrogenase complex dihydrolipoamide dehydrogenase (E3) component